MAAIIENIDYYTAMEEWVKNIPFNLLSHSGRSLTVTYNRVEKDRPWQDALPRGGDGNRHDAVRLPAMTLLFFLPQRNGERPAHGYYPQVRPLFTGYNDQTKQDLEGQTTIPMTYQFQIDFFARYALHMDQILMQFLPYLQSKPYICIEKDKARVDCRLHVESEEDSSESTDEGLGESENLKRYTYTIRVEGVLVYDSDPVSAVDTLKAEFDLEGNQPPQTEEQTIYGSDT